MTRFLSRQRSWPARKRVVCLIPAGTYRISSLFLKDDVSIELDEGAVLSAFTDRSRFPVFKGMIQSYNEKDEYNLVPGGKSSSYVYSYYYRCERKKCNDLRTGNDRWKCRQRDWWKDPKIMNGAFRPRMVFLERCEHVVLQGITVQNSPSWNLHPYFSDNLRSWT